MRNRIGDQATLFSVFSALYPYRDKFSCALTVTHNGLCELARNIHRGKAAAFATDARALAAAEQAIQQGWDLNAPEPERQFFYMPFEHSEDMADQDRAVMLLTERLSSDPDMALHARAHREIIARFGRFPFRNEALGRDTPPDEAAFLAEGGYMSIVNTLKSSHAASA